MAPLSPQYFSSGKKTRAPSFCYFEDYPLDKPIYIYLRLKSHYFDVDTFKKDPPKSQLTPREEKFNAVSLKLAQKIQRHIPWLPRRKEK